MQKTPDKENFDANGEKTPEKITRLEEPKTGDLKKNSGHSNEALSKIEFEFKTPEKTRRSDSVSPSVENNLNKNKTPEKNVLIDNSDLKPEETSCEWEDGMISTTEQARLLIAANKTPSKCENKTPVKETNLSGKRSVESSPVTPGKYKRIDLITLASPKAKRIKQI